MQAELRTTTLAGLGDAGGSRRRPSDTGSHHGSTCRERRQPNGNHNASATEGGRNRQFLNFPDNGSPPPRSEDHVIGVDNNATLCCGGTLGVQTLQFKRRLGHGQDQHGAQWRKGVFECGSEVLHVSGCLRYRVSLLFFFLLSYVRGRVHERFFFVLMS